MVPIIAAKRALLDEEPEWRSLFDFVVHTLFYQRSEQSGGGSTSASIGVIWCANRRDWTTQEVKEFLVHEFAHNLLFLDERAHRHYLDFDQIAQSSNWIKSTILLRNRPLDKVVHSVVVAYDVLCYRDRHGVVEANNLHGSSNDLVAAMRQTIDELDDKPEVNQLLTPRSTWILREVANNLRHRRAPVAYSKLVAA